VAVTDFFAPGNADQLGRSDGDFGSGGPVVLPFGTSAYPHLIATAGKDGRIFLLNGASLGGRSKVDVHPPPGKNCTAHSGAVFCGFASTSATAHGMWGHMAGFSGAGGAYYVWYSGVNDRIQVLRFSAAHPAAPVLTNVGHSAVKFGYSSGSPYITSNGGRPSTAVLWEVYAKSGTGANARLYAYAAIPGASGVLRKLWSAPIGVAAEFTVPATSGGRVYVGTRGDENAAGQPIGAVYGFAVR
jgi:hypothetical protein